MKTCKTCKYWEKPEGEWSEIPGIGRCKVVVQYWDASEWLEQENGLYYRALKQEYSGKLAFVQDGSDYWAELKTFPDFGCVQWAQA